MKRFALFLCLVACGQSVPLVDDLIAYKSKEDNMYHKAIDHFYDKDVRPPGLQNVDDPIEIQTSLYVHEMNFCTQRQMITFGGYFRQFWTDRRLVATSNDDEKQLIVRRFEDMFENRKIWVPDTFVIGSESKFVLDGPARSFLRFTADGSVASSFRLKAELQCPYNGLDSEVECSMEFESYGHKTLDVMYKWKEEEESVLISEMSKTYMRNKGWEIVSYTGENVLTALKTGTYSGVKFIVKLRKI